MLFNALRVNEFLKLILNLFFKIFFISLAITFILFFLEPLSIAEGFILGSLVFLLSMMIIKKTTDIIFLKSLKNQKKNLIIFFIIIGFFIKICISICLISLVFILKANIIAFLIGVLFSFVLFIFIFQKEYKIKGGDSV